MRDASLNADALRSQCGGLATSAQVWRNGINRRLMLNFAEIPSG